MTGTKSSSVQTSTRPDFSTVIKGRNVSGRSWKKTSQKRASSLIKTATNNQTKSFEERQALKRKRQETIELQKQLKEERIQQLRDKRERRIENEKRRAENEYESAKKSAQSLNLNKVHSKLKTMSKKQLRQIKKTRVNPKTGATEFVPAYAK